MRGIGTTRLADWLDRPDPFDAVTAFLHDRGLTSSARVMLAIVSASSMLAPLALVVPTYHDVTLVFAGIIALVGCCLSCVMTWFWLTHWPTRRQSLVTVSLCTACIVGWSVGQPSAALAALTCAHHQRIYRVFPQQPSAVAEHGRGSGGIRLCRVPTGA
jgi:transposase InsO family protein